MYDTIMDSYRCRNEPKEHIRIVGLVHSDESSIAFWLLAIFEAVQGEDDLSQIPSFSHFSGFDVGGQKQRICLNPMVRKKNLHN